MAIDVSAVKSEFGAYYLNNGQNANNLVKKIYQPSETAKYFKEMRTENDLYRVSEALRARVLQPFQKAFTPVGNVVFTPHEIKLFGLKIDDSFFPDDLEGSWLAFVAGMEEPDRAKWPFVRWLLEEHLAPRAESDYELNEIYAGAYTAPTAGTAGNAGTAMNGIKFLINEAIDDSLITPITTGSLATDAEDFCTEVEGFFKSINPLYRPKIDFVFMNQENALLYLEGKRIKYNTNYNQENLNTIANFPNARVVGLPSMGSSDKIWCTIPENRVRLVKSTNRMRNLKVESLKREVFVMGDWKEGVGFLMPSLVFTNDVELNP
jgi:hypothetical protein